MKFKQLKAIVFEWAVKICRLGTTWYKSVLYVTCCQTFLLLISYKPKDVYSVRYRTIRGVSADSSTIADRMGSLRLITSLKQSVSLLRMNSFYDDSASFHLLDTWYYPMSKWLEWGQNRSFYGWVCITKWTLNKGTLVKTMKHF